MLKLDLVAMTLASVGWTVGTAGQSEWLVVPRVSNRMSDAYQRSLDSVQQNLSHRMTPLRLSC